MHFLELGFELSIALVLLKSKTLIPVTLLLFDKEYSIAKYLNGKANLFFCYMPKTFVFEITSSAFIF